MSAEPIVAREFEGVSDVLARMRTHGIRRLPIVDDDGKLVGLLTFDDLVELFAEQLDLLAGLVPRQTAAERAERR
jgi:CBS domain-containing protein